VLKGFSSAAPPVAGGSTLKGRVGEVERELIQEALVRHGGVIRKAAADLGMSPVTLGRKVKRYKLKAA